MEAAIGVFAQLLQCPIWYSLSLTIHSNSKKGLRQAHSLGDCGHTFCQPCIMQFFKEESKSYKCPSCSQPVIIRNLRKDPLFITLAACAQKLTDLVQERNTCKKDPYLEGFSGPGINEESSRKTKKGTPKRKNSFLKTQSPTPKALSRRPTPRAPIVRAKVETPRSISKQRVPRTPIQKKVPVPAKSLTEPRIKIERNKLVLTVTGLSEDQRLMLSSSYSHISHPVSVSLHKTYSQAVTHVVTSCNSEGFCGRTVKYLRALLEGKHIVSFDCKSHIC